VVKFQISDATAIPAPFNLVQQWVRFGKHSLCKHGNQGMWFTAKQKRHDGIAGLKYEVG
jgi:hypothetical protein